MSLEIIAAASPKDFNALPGTFKRLAVVPRDSELGRARMRGWNDYRNGLPFRSSYDLWPRLNQFAYERGRMQAALVKAARPDAELPAWGLDSLVDDIIRRHLPYDTAQRIIEETRVAKRRKLSRKARKAKKGDR